MAPGFSMMGLTSAVDPLRVANRFAPETFSWEFVSARGGAVTASNRMTVLTRSIQRSRHQPDLVLVCTGFDVDAAVTPNVLEWLRKQAQNSVRLGGIDTGSVLLARAGLLKNRRATIHWEALAAFQEDFLDVNAVDDLFVLDRDCMTCSGGTAALDMMLQHIGLRYGESLAKDVSEQFLVDRIREPGQGQRMDATARFGIHSPPLRKAVQCIERHLDAPLTQQQLAEHVGISVRHLQRLFQEHLQTTPTTFDRTLRLERAWRLLRQTDLPVVEVAVACGFASASHFARVFREHYKRSPKNVRSPTEHPV
nr:GlxA family transcriptional regulator [Desulfohalobium retbaense]